MYRSNLGSKVDLLGVCIRFDLDYIYEYEFGPHRVQSWLGLIEMLESFSYRDQENIFLKLNGKFVHFFRYYLGEYLAKKNKNFLIL